MRPVTIEDGRVVTHGEPDRDNNRGIATISAGADPYAALREHTVKQLAWIDGGCRGSIGLPFGTMFNEAQLRAVAALLAERDQLLAAMKRDGWSPLTCGVCYTEYPAPNCPKCSGRRPPTPGDTPA